MTVSQHQANHTRILGLRAEAEALETQLRSSISTLASLRQELLQVPTSTPPKDSRPVPVSELLKYAMYISNYTVPPTFREEMPSRHASPDKDRDASAQPGTAQAPIAVEEGANKPENEMAPTKEQAEWLKQMTEQGIDWKPYPTDETIRRGNLMKIQDLLDRQQDPWTAIVRTEQEIQEAEQQEKDEEEKRRQQKEEDDRRAHEEAARRREQAPPVSAVEPQQVQQFTGFDFGDDEDE